LPLYDYQCQACGHVTEVRHGFRETYDAPCEKCGGAVARKFSAAPIIFTGSGFYITDSRKGGEAAATASGGDTPKAGTDTPKAGGDAPKTGGESKKSESPAA